MTSFFKLLPSLDVINSAMSQTWYLVAVNIFEQLIQNEILTNQTTTFLLLSEITREVHGFPELVAL